MLPTDDRQTLTHQDSIPGGLVLENYGPEPITVYSHTERRQLMAQRGLQLRERFSPTPGTDRDPAGIPNPAGYMDTQTLENAKVLLLRAQRAEPVDPIQVNYVKGTINNDEAITIQHEVEHARS